MPAQGYTKFFLEFVRHPGSVGAVAPSSPQLAEATVRAIDWQDVRVVVEFGPGTGAITQAILAHLPEGARFLAIERNARFVELLRQQFPQVAVHQDTVANVRVICDAQGIGHVDAVVSGLPWSFFSDEEQTACLDGLRQALGPGGQFATYAYLTGLVQPSAQRFRSRLHQYFRHVRRTRVIWRNLPPAFIYHCRK